MPHCQIQFLETRIGARARKQGAATYLDEEGHLFVGVVEKDGLEDGNVPSRKVGLGDVGLENQVGGVGLVAKPARRRLTYS